MAYTYVTDPTLCPKIAAELRKAKVAALDLETAGPREAAGLDPLTGRIRLLSINTEKGIYVIDVFAVGDAIQCILDVLHNPEQLTGEGHPIVVGQNLAYDQKWLYYKHGTHLWPVFCTYRAAALLRNGLVDYRGKPLANDLFTLYEDYLKMKPQVGDFGASGWGNPTLTKGQVDYAADDVEHLPKLRLVLRQKLIEMGLIVAASIEFGVILPEVSVELAGFRIEEESWRELAKVNSKQALKLRDELVRELPSPTTQGTLFGYDPKFNPGASEQLLASLHKLKLKDAETGQLIADTSEGTLAPFAATYPEVAKLLEWRGVSMQAKTFGASYLKYIHPVDGRIHATYRGTLKTGRYGHSKPNLGQIPRDKQFRKRFKPLPGRRLIICVAEGTRVATTDGLVPVERVVVGAQALQENGAAFPVAAHIDNGVRKVVRVTTRGGYELVCTPEHRVRVLDVRGEYVWRRARDLRSTDAVAIQTGRGLTTETPALPPSGPKHHPRENDCAVPSHATLEFAEWAGYVTGDGSFGETTLTWVVCDEDLDVADSLKRTARSVFGREVQTRRYRGVDEAWTCGRVLMRWLDALGMGKDRVPEFLWRSSPEVVGSYLRGLFEADGSVGLSDVSRGWLKWSCVHERIAREVQELLLALGIMSVRECDRHGKLGAGRLWSVRIPYEFLGAFATRVGFMSARKRGRLAALVTRAEASPKSSEVVSVPNIGAKMRARGFPDAEARRLLNNACFGKRPLGVKLARRVAAKWPDYAKASGLTRVTDDGTYFMPLESVEPAGEARVYDLSVPGPTAYLSAGYCSHNCDYGNVEMVTAAEIARERVLTQLFIEGRDAHKYLGSKIAGVPESELTKEQRQQAKPGNFGFLYGMGWKKFIIYALVGYKVAFTAEKAQIVRAAFFDGYPRFKPWHQECLDEVRYAKMIRTVSGRLRYLDPDETYSEAFNTPVQGTAADGLKRALRYVFNSLQKYGMSTVLPGRPAVEIVHHVHDEIILEADDREEVLHPAKDDLEHGMLLGMREFIKAVPVKADASFAADWSDKA